MLDGRARWADLPLTLTLTPFEIGGRGHARGPSAESFGEAASLSIEVFGPESLRFVALAGELDFDSARELSDYPEVPTRPVVADLELLRSGRRRAR